MQVMVRQDELREIFTLEREVAPKLERIDELKSNIKALLIHKMPVEMGRFDVKLIKRFNRHVTWHQGFVDRLGLAAAQAYAKLFKPRMFCDVVVEEHAVAPLWRGGEPGQEVGS